MMPDRKLQPPSRAALLREALVVFELPRFFVSLPWLATRRRVSGEPVIVVPGFATSDSWTVVLRKYLEYLGYNVRGWELGVNGGNVAKLRPRLLEKVKAAHQQTGKRIRLIGWSLGGYLAREVARECPDAVDRVITLGAPIIGGPKYTQTGRAYRKKGYNLDEIEAQVRARSSVPLRVPVTAIYSRLDGVVAWSACLDHTERDVTHHEVKTTHMGMVLSPEVLLVVAEKLW